MPLSTKNSKIRMGEMLKQVANRVDEIDALVSNLLATDQKFAAMAIGEQAAELEYRYIFGPLGNSQHFLKSDWYSMLKAKQNGRMPEIKAEAILLEAVLEAVEVEPKGQEK